MVLLFLILNQLSITYLLYIYIYTNLLFINQHCFNKIFIPLRQWAVYALSRMVDNLKKNLIFLPK